MEKKPFHEEKGIKWPSWPSCLWERRGLGILNQGLLGEKRTWKSQPSCFNEQLPLGKKGLSWKKRRIGVLTKLSKNYVLGPSFLVNTMKTRFPRQLRQVLQKATAPIARAVILCIFYKTLEINIFFLVCNEIITYFKYM
jgi:hypothetical protein